MGLRAWKLGAGEHRGLEEGYPLSFPLIIFRCITLVKAFTFLTSGPSFGKHKEAGLAVPSLLRVESLTSGAWQGTFLHSPVEHGLQYWNSGFSEGRHRARLPSAKATLLQLADTPTSVLEALE